MNVEEVFSKLTKDEQQQLIDQLHAAGVYPSRLIGMGSPAHVEAINANLNDLRGILQLNAVTMGKFYELIGRSPGLPPEEIKKEKEPEA